MGGSRTIRTSVVLLALFAVACDHATPASAEAPPSKGKVMSRFAKASSSFREHAIKVLGTSAVDAGPNNERVTMPATVGAAWAFTANATGKPERPLRGWALADGTVITLEQNLGKLLEAGGLWATPRGDFYKVQEAIAWALGNEYAPKADAEIKLGADGAGAIKFELTYQQSGGGGHISAQMPVDVAITVAKDHTATLKSTRRP